jgi:hypothetical protein
VTMQRGTVELRQNIDPSESGIETVANWYIDQSIFASQRDRWFCTIFGQRKKTCSGSASHDDGECSDLQGRRVHCLQRGPGNAVCAFTHLASVQFLCHDGFYLCAG